MDKQVAHYQVGQRLNYEAFIDSDDEHITDDVIVSRIMQYFNIEHKHSVITKEELDTIWGDLQMGEFQLVNIHEV